MCIAISSTSISSSLLHLLHHPQDALHLRRRQLQAELSHNLWYFIHLELPRPVRIEPPEHSDDRGFLFTRVPASAARTVRNARIGVMTDRHGRSAPRRSSLAAPRLAAHAAGCGRGSSRGTWHRSALPWLFAWSAGQGRHPDRARSAPPSSSWAGIPPPPPPAEGPCRHVRGRPCRSLNQSERGAAVSQRV